MCLHGLWGYRFVLFSSVSVYKGFGLRNKLRDGPLHNEKARGCFFSYGLCGSTPPKKLLLVQVYIGFAILHQVEPVAKVCRANRGCGDHAQLQSVPQSKKHN